MSTLLALLLALPLSVQRVAVPQAQEPAAGASAERATLVVAGRVKKDNALACGIPVRVGLVSAGEVLVEVAAASGHDGTFRVELEDPRDLDDGARLFAFARAVEPGHQQREKRQLVRASADVDVGAVELHAGGTIVLRVVDADGELLRKSDVRLIPFPGRPEPGPVLSAWREAGAEWPSIDARPAGPSVYSVSLAPGASLSMLARASGVGTAWLEDLAAPGDGAPLEVEMVLRGPATLAGVLMSPDGVPLPDVELAAFPADLIDAANPGQEVEIVRAPRESAGGLVTDRTTTDADGRFSFRGLQAGTYFVQCARPNAQAPIERRALPTGLDARVVARQHRLVVDVIALDGGTLAGTLSCRRLPDPAEWRHFSRREGDPGERIRVEGRRRIELDVAPGWRYAVAWNGDGRFVEREVAIEHAVWRTPVELRPAEAESLARVSVIVRPAAGGTYEPLDLEELRMTITSAATGALVRGRLASPYAPNDVELPAGDYVLAVESGYEHVMCGNGVTWPLLWHGSDRTELHLAPGEQRELVVALWIGGRVRLTLDVPDDVADPRMRDVPSSKADWPGFMLLWQDPSFPRATVTANGSGKGLDFFLVDDGTGTSAVPGGMLPGTTAVTSTLLRPGPNVLRIEVPGFEPAEVRVVARPGEVVDARLLLRESR